MSQLRQRPALAKKEVVPTTIVLAALSPTTESLAADVAAQYPHVAVAKTVAALETQQLDHSAQMAAIDEVKDTLDKYDEEHPHTGPLHVYLLDGQGKAVMDQVSEETPLKALVNAALRDKSKIVAALLPEDATVNEVADISPATMLRQLADTILATESIPVIVGKTAFDAFIANPESFPSKPEA